MLLDLRSLTEPEAIVGTHTGTAAPATASGTGQVIPVSVFPSISGPGPRPRPEPQRIVAYGVAIAAPATAHAVGTVRPSRLLSDAEALSLLGFDLLEILDLLGVDRLPVEAEAVALALGPSSVRSRIVGAGDVIVEEGDHSDGR